MAMRENSIKQSRDATRVSGSVSLTPPAMARSICTNTDGLPATIAAAAAAADGVLARPSAVALDGLAAAEMIASPDDGAVSAGGLMMCSGGVSSLWCAADETPFAVADDDEDDADAADDDDDEEVDAVAAVAVVAVAAVGRLKPVVLLGVPSAALPGADLGLVKVEGLRRVVARPPRAFGVDADAPSAAAASASGSLASRAAAAAESGFGGVGLGASASGSAFG